MTSGTAPSDPTAADAVPVTAVPATPAQAPARDPRSLGAAIWSQLFLRVAASAGLLVIGSYFADLQRRGVPMTSLLLGLVTALVYVTELLFAPLAGALSDTRGRKRFLLAGPALAAVAVLLPPLGALAAAVPPLALVLALVGASRLIEGLGSAVSVPATLGFLAEGTDDSAIRRGRQMSFYELASSGGIALGAFIGPLLWAHLGPAAFLVLSLVYAVAAGVVLLVREPTGAAHTNSGNAGMGLFDWRRSAAVLQNRDLALFIPAWVAVNAILGVWITAQIAFILTGNLHAPGQRFVGSLSHHEAQLSAILGGYVVWFSLCVVAWAFLLGRLSRLPTLFVTVFGSIVASVGLVALNHGAAPAAFVPVVALGVFLEAGFTPAALAYLADNSRAHAGDRGLLMGLYSVILGLGYFLGNVLGAVAAQVAYFDGLAALTVLLAAVAMLAVGALWLRQRGVTG
jgi:MFS family permease